MGRFSGKNQYIWIIEDGPSTIAPKIRSSYLKAHLYY